MSLINAISVLIIFLFVSSFAYGLVAGLTSEAEDDSFIDMDSDIDNSSADFDYIKTLDPNNIQQRKVRREILNYTKNRSIKRSKIEQMYKEELMRRLSEIEKIKKEEVECAINKRINQIGALHLLITSGDTVPPNVISIAKQDSENLLDMANEYQKVILNNFLKAAN